ncbi:TIGR04013 family B12-binding domain/radical SAM domain-containing protein [Desulfurococcus amylolyticus]|uniref:Radical SAM domain protein n=1 Tax=Desulfurococcus amylolyticus DSM 16532 TaxID=768672 RepID=I3XQ19_DESAM|nr:TIGR04013 family B12-binding domain/radical SAM domain-containing protein [Desulfurococcus amylolyticus]AFL66043.1 Radical SAM domain protein [Desulfurococcus amylolyticus DSM 16532]
MSVRLILWYDKTVRYSLNPLIAVADKIPSVRVVLAEDTGELYAAVNEALMNNEKCVVGYSILTTMLVNDAFLSELKSILKYLEEKNCITIAGGPHATGDPLGTLFSLGFKVAFIGEAEESLDEFLRHLVNGTDPFTTKGIVFREEDKVIATGRARPVDLDKHDPFPYWRRIINPLEITRGCPYGCLYCQVSYIHGMSYRHRSIEKIVFYVKEMARIGVRDYRFITPDSLSYGLTKISREPDTGLIEELLSSIHSALKSIGGRIFYGSFPSEVRPEHVNKDVVRVLRKYVNNREIIIGAQSGSNRVLRLIRRGHSVEDVLNAVKEISENGFTPSVDIILGIPGETREDQELTLELIDEVIRNNGRIHIHYYLPLPGSPLGLHPPARIPNDIEVKISRLIGSGKAYGSWFSQKELSEKIIKLHERGVIVPSLYKGSFMKTF